MRTVLAVFLITLTLALSGGGELSVGAAGARAQDSIELPDYDTWEAVALRAEKALQDNRASDTALEQLRAELVEWRTQFLAAQSVNGSRISTLKNQLEALGPAPETEGVEPAELTARRRELEAQLAELEAPVKRAEEAYSRADGLITEIDALIRDRQAERFFELSPSPANPSHWTPAANDIWATLIGVRTEVVSAWNSLSGQENLRRNLPLIIGYLVVAVVLLARGRSWMVRLTQRLQGAGPGAGLRGFAVSLGQMALPVIGLYALVQALRFSNLLGFRGQLIADGIMVAGTAFFVARWLALRVAPRAGQRAGALQLPDSVAGRFRGHAALLGLAWGAGQLISRLSDFESYPDETVVIANFPIITLAGYGLFRLGQVLRRTAADQARDNDSQWSFRARGSDILGRALMVIGPVGPLAALIGYTAAAQALVFPTILSLGLLALLLILSGVSRDIYAFVTNTDEEKAREALVPVLMGLVLVILSVPVFALIWGARVSDLTEIWARFMEGFQIGDTRISPTDFLTFAIVFAVGYVVTRMLQASLKNSILPKTRIDPGGQSAIVSGVGYLGVFLAAVIAITMAGIDLSSLAIVAGALSVGIGFGLQNIVSNFVSGIILLIERPITEGDWIEAGGQMGTVREISVRSTRIETFDRYDVIIPNADLVSGPVINYTRQNLIGRAIIRVGVAYGTDTKRVADILREIAEAHPMVLLNPAPGVHFVGFGADSLDFEVRVILRDVNFKLTVKSDIHHEIARRFAEEGIEIPFAQRDLWLRNPEALRGADGGHDTEPDGKDG